MPQQRAPKDSTDKRLAYLREHVAYERRMLGYTFEKLHSTEPGDAWNAMYESFGIHARNIYDFLRNDGKAQTTFRADDYVSNRKTPHALLSFNEFDTFIFHMSTSRAEREKINMDRIQELGKWLDEHWAEWVDKLPDSYAGVLTNGPVCNGRPLQNGVTNFTACTVVTASTLSTAAVNVPLVITESGS